MRPINIHVPDSFDEASELLLEHDAKPIAGGSAVITLMKEGVMQPQPLVNLRRLQADHSYVREEGGELRLGALTRLRTIETDDLVREHVPVVADCLSEIASIRIRNAATIGGHLAHADPSLDLPPVLAGLDVDVVVHGPDAERTVPFDEFVQGFYQTDLGDGELIKEVRITPPDREAVYLKHRTRSEADWPCVGVAAFLDDDPGAIPEVIMSSVADTPTFRVEGIADVVDGEIDGETVERIGDLAKRQCDPVADSRGTEWYKREMAREFTIRAVRTVSGIEPAIPAEGGA